LIEGKKEEDFKLATCKRTEAPFGYSGQLIESERKFETRVGSESILGPE